MSRSDRREQEREYAKFNKKFNKLSQSQKEVANKIGREMANMYIKKLLDGLDRSISAAAILLGMDMKKADECSFLSGKLLAEDTYKIQEFENQFKKEEDCQMAIKKINEDVKSEVEKLINEGVNKKEAIEKLVFKFPKLSKAMITNAYQKVKEEIEEKSKDKKEDQEVEKAAEEILGIIDGEITKEVTKETLEKWDKKYNPNGKLAAEVKEIEKSEENKEEVNEMEAKEVVANNATTENKLQVIEEVKIIKVKGENGEYEADSRKGVMLKNEGITMFFESIEQLDNFTSEFKKVFKMVK